MENFTNILYVSDGLSDETTTLKQALSLARNNDAKLRVLIHCPETPPEFSDYAQKFDDMISAQLSEAIQNVCDSLQIDMDAIDVSLETNNGGRPALETIRHVLDHNHDLVIKQAAQNESGKGFKAMDMELLRKCPCPVWLGQDIQRHRQDINVAVAIDPEDEEEAGHGLSLRLLQLARSLADSCSGTLNIIACWDYEFEAYLRHNPFAPTPEDKIEAYVTQEQQSHRNALDKLITESGIAGDYRIWHIRGKPDTMIPQHVQDEDIDILVMGTLARTGIPGFMIGNTAENIIQQLNCSLLALKPEGFVSPVKAG